MEHARTMQKELGLRTTGPVTPKDYTCCECDKRIRISTNHWGWCYLKCDTCRKVTEWKCLDKMPKGYVRPARWKMVKLGEVARIL